jgi:hypothetical protein
VNDDGRVVVSGVLREADRRLLSVDSDLIVAGLNRCHLSYLLWHRKHIFKKSPAQQLG